MSVSARTPLPVTFREAHFDDYIDIESVQSRNGLVAKKHEEWKHLWINNPTYKKRTRWHLGWVAENEEGKIVGYVGHVPLSYEFRGRDIVGACAHGMCIDSSYRGRGHHLLKRHLSEENTDVALTSNANPNSARLCEALCSRVPTGNWSEMAFWITNYHGFSVSALRRKGWPDWLSRPASVGLSLRDRFSTGRASIRHDSAGQVQPCSGFDERFDTFWEELKRAYPERFLATRSREALRWHFQYSLLQNKVWIVSAGDDSRLTAYAIFYRKDRPAIGLKRVRLIDFQVLQQDTQVLIPILAWAFRKCQEEGIHVLEAFGFRPEKQRVIDSLRPHRRTLASWHYFYRSRGQALGQQLKDPAVWDPSQFDGDSTL